MAPRNNEETSKKGMNKGAWTAEEDRKVSQYIEIHGPKRWSAIAAKSGVNRCGKSCRLRWLNYLRPNIKRGNISDEEEDLILRLHKLLGNRWSLIAGRLPGRTDNEIKNYWNSYLIKKIKQKKEKARVVVETPSSKSPAAPSLKSSEVAHVENEREDNQFGIGDDFDLDELFDFSNIGSSGLDWVDQFIELDEEVLPMDDKI